MSNTEHYTPTITLETKGAIRRIADRAQTLVDESAEQNSLILSSADTVISEFAELLDTNPKMHLKDAIEQAKRLPLSTSDAPTKREYMHGAELAGNALELSAKVEMRDSTHTKARMWLNRHIDQRERATGSMPVIRKRKHSNGDGRRDPHRRSAFNGKKRG